MTADKTSSTDINPELQTVVNTELETDKFFMQRAYQLAEIAEQHNEIPVGAIVVVNGKIIGEGYNQSIMLNDPSAHAEMIAIRQAGQYLKNYRLIDCTLYVTLEPCPMCAGLSVHGRVKRLVYAADDAKTGAAGSLLDLVNNPNLNHQLEVTKGVMAEECSRKKRPKAKVVEPKA
jgi:tRNA(adenine34) deaminase